MDFKKREVVNEAFCSFIESRAKSVSTHENILMAIKKNTPKKYIFEVLDSTQKMLKKSKWQKCYDSIPCKGVVVITFLIIMSIMSVAAQITKFWLVGLIGLVITICLSCMNFIPNDKNRNWLYLLELRLRLLLWKIPPIDNDMKNPRCVFVYVGDIDDSEDWIMTRLLPKLQDDLGIKMSDELAHSLQNAESSSPLEFQEYSYWRDAVMGSRGNVPLWCFCIIIMVGIPGIVVGVVYHIAYTWAQFFSWVGGISTTVGVLYKIYNFCYNNATNIPTEPDIEANKQLVDVICRLQRVMRNETIFFTLVNFDGEIPKGMSQYFKFFIDLKCFDLLQQYKQYFRRDSKYHHFFYWKFDYSLLEFASPTYEKVDRFLKVVLQHVRDVLLTPIDLPNSSVISKNPIKFLSHLVKTNDAHNILSSIDILHTVCRGVLIYYTNPGICTLILGSTWEWWEVDVSSQLTPEIQLSLSDIETLEKDNPDTTMRSSRDKFFICLNEYPIQ